jgi:hypothetical protein
MSDPPTDDDGRDVVSLRTFLVALGAMVAGDFS